MLTTTLDKLPTATKDKVNKLFLDAAIAIECGADWKRVFIKARNTNTGFVRRFSEFWLKQTDKELIKAIDIFFGG